MERILVSGLTNIEITLQVEGFPIPYSPVRYPFFGVNSTVSGVGYNIATALTTLGAPVAFLSIIGRDWAARAVMEALAAAGIDGRRVIQGIAHTPQSVILYDREGRRAINLDLKDIQDQTYPTDQFAAALGECALAVLCNVNFSRPMLREARRAGKPVATDVHTISDLDDAYNRDFMQHANILFMSHERLPCPPEQWAGRVQQRYGNDIVVIGMGAEGRCSR
ncbi:MAG: carbohydrate kinase family protein [Anaerolineae bacterium]|nr:carbohydrate kinase family protein [Anaerolineae bacterium]